MTSAPTTSKTVCTLLILALQLKEDPRELLPVNHDCSSGIDPIMTKYFNAQPISEALAAHAGRGDLRLIRGKGEKRVNRKKKKKREALWF